MELSNLIKQCGNKIMNIRKVWDKNGNITNWIAESDTEPVIFTIGDTPEIAVNKLLQELNK